MQKTSKTGEKCIKPDVSALESADFTYCPLSDATLTDPTGALAQWGCSAHYHAQPISPSQPNQDAPQAITEQDSEC